MRALYQERGSSEYDDEQDEEESEDLMDKFKNKMSDMFSTKSKKDDIVAMKKKADQEYIKTSMDSYKNKHHKNSLQGMLEASGSTVEDYEFNIPEKALTSSSTSSSSLEGQALNLSEQQNSSRSKQRQAQRIQVHCLKQWRIKQSRQAHDDIKLSQQNYDPDLGVSVRDEMKMSMSQMKSEFSQSKQRASANFKED